MRATKLARSILAALESAQVVDEWLAPDLAGAVIAGLRARGEPHPVRTDVIADAVVRVLVAAGHPGAAAHYHAVRGERDRRRAVSRLSPESRGAEMWSALGVPGAVREFPCT